MKPTGSLRALGNGICFAAAALFLIAANRPVASAGGALVLDATIALHQVSGRIDHLAVDVARRRLYVAELGNDSVDAIDLATKKATGRIAGLDQPQGLAFLPGKAILTVANAGDGELSFFRAADLWPVGSLALGNEARILVFRPVP